MVFLILTILVSSLVPTILKYANQKGLNVDNVMLVNYGIAAAFSSALAFRSDLLPSFGFLGNCRLSCLFSEPTLANTCATVLIFGILSGFLYIACLYLSRYSVVENGMGISSMSNRLSFIVPLAFSVIVWKEKLSPSSTAGVIMAVASVSVIVLESLGNRRVPRPMLLVGLLVFNGLVEINNKIVIRYSIRPEYKDLFIFVIFTVAFTVCLVCTIFNNRRTNEKFRITPLEIEFGIGLGLPNMTNSYFLLKALEALPTAAVYASIASGGVMMSSLIGRFLFQEKLTPYQKLAIVLTIISVLLANIS